MNKKSIRDIDLQGRRVLMRADFNVPLDKELNITDDNRIRAALPTIRYALDRDARLILMSHLGRPKGEVKPEFSLKPVAQRLGKLLGKTVEILSDCVGDEVKAAVAAMSSGDAVLLENLRFHRQETENDPEFAKELASSGDLFVNDAFGTCHRAHASTEGVTRYLEAVSGLLVEKEIKYFEKVLTSAERPFVFILGGAKVSDKIPVIENMMNRSDMIIIGGAMAYTFMKAKGVDIGSSRVEDEMLDTANKILGKAKAMNIDILLPVDSVVTDNIETAVHVHTTESEAIQDGWIGVDIGRKTINLYKDRLSGARMVVWNGPVGIFENDRFAAGTEALAKAIAGSSATSVVGGGDTAAAVVKFGVADGISHISTGGGASLEYLEGKKLPGIAALADR